jgi:hypothetical protein
MGEWEWFLPLCVPRSAPPHHISAVLLLLHSLCCSLSAFFFATCHYCFWNAPMCFVLCLLLPLFVEKARTLSQRKGVCCELCVPRGYFMVLRGCEFFFFRALVRAGSPCIEGGAPRPHVCVPV